MADPITNQIIKQINALPIAKRKALLELIKTDTKSVSHHANGNSEKWRKKLLTTSVWTDEQVNEIAKAREFINKWSPQQFF